MNDFTIRLLYRRCLLLDVWSFWTVIYYSFSSSRRRCCGVRCCTTWLRTTSTHFLSLMTVMYIYIHRYMYVCIHLPLFVQRTTFLTKKLKLIRYFILNWIHFFVFFKVICMVNFFLFVFYVQIVLCSWKSFLLSFYERKSHPGQLAITN